MSFLEGDYPYTTPILFGWDWKPRSDSIREGGRETTWILRVGTRDFFLKNPRSPDINLGFGELGEWICGFGELGEWVESTLSPCILDLVVWFRLIFTEKTMVNHPFFTTNHGHWKLQFVGRGCGEGIPDPGMWDPCQMAERNGEWSESSRLPGKTSSKLDTPLKINMNIITEVWFRSFSLQKMGDGCRFQPLIFQGVLGGGFKYFLFSPLLGEDSHFD